MKARGNCVLLQTQRPYALEDVVGAFVIHTMLLIRSLELEARETISCVITWASSDTPRPVRPRFDALVAFAHDGSITSGNHAQHALCFRKRGVV